MSYFQIAVVITSKKKQTENKPYGKTKFWRR
jgi:hypothetical protein